ncbi:MAG: NusG domain II-containing protein [Butyrivibrio sp.]|nr:NusG domain II-containing protein [Muribaculum sp.]MCM1552058.1 NusG domain II-containing protein [Butyrivibrio sp.]
MLAFVISVIFLLSLILSIYILHPSQSHIVEIVQDDTILYTLDMTHAEDQEFTIHYDKGSSNTIQIQNGKIRVSEAECPDKTCVNMEELYSESLPIVCLPNHLIIRFAE